MLSPFTPPSLPLQQRFTFTESQLAPLATALVNVLKPNAIISIEGGLGAGKTTLIRTIGQAMGIETRITSPTYVYFNQYQLPANPTGITQLLHVDFYRLSENETPTTDAWLVEELLELQAQAPTLILTEWASVVASSLSPLITHQLQIHAPITADETTAQSSRCYDWFSQQALAL
jgi:tRNA threonylcarbamoyladenosine biosynthesis protein TsaE